MILIDPDAQSATVFRPSSSEERLSKDGLLDLAPVIPGFTCKLEQIFTDPY